MSTSTAAKAEHTEAQLSVPVRAGPGRGAVARAGCLALILLLCALAGSVAALLREGPASIELPGGTLLALGSDDVVVSNYQFQNGDTYFFDLNGNGVRNILQVHFIDDSRSLELMLKYSDSDEQKEHRLLTLRLP